MLIVMQSHATEEQIRAVCARIESLGLKAHPIPGSLRTAIGITGNKGSVDLGVLESMAGVVECIPVSKPYKLVSRDAKEEDTVLRIPTPSGRRGYAMKNLTRLVALARIREGSAPLTCLAALQ